MSASREPFAERQRLMTVRRDVMEVAQQIRATLGPEQAAQLRVVLQTYHPADLADAMLFMSEQEDTAVFQALDTEEAAEVLDEVDAATEARLIGVTSPDRLADMLEHLPPDEGADVVGGMSHEEAERVLTLTDTDDSAGNPRAPRVSQRYAQAASCPWAMWMCRTRRRRPTPLPGSGKSRMRNTSSLSMSWTRRAACADR